MKTKETYIRCTKCNGSGLVYDKTLAIFTAGIAPVISWLLGDAGNKNDYDECPQCKGSKVILSSREILKED